MPADQTPLPGLAPEDEAAQNQMPTASPPSGPSNYPSNLGSNTGGDLDHETAALTWRTLAPHLTRSPHMRLRRYNRAVRRHIYPTDEALTTELPRRPAALRTFTDGGVAWSIALDFDAKHHSAAAVAQHADDAARFFTRLGGSTIVDVATSGGRHVWVPLTVPMNLHQARQLAAACRRLWPSLDISPTVGPTEGCLTAPGSRCKDGRFRTLVTPLPDAVRAVTRRSAHDLIDRALTLLTDLVGPPEDEAPPHRPRPVAGGALRPLGPVHAYIAERGIWPSDRTTDQNQPWTRSEACYAVLRAAAARGYTEDDILHRLESGQWSGLLALYTGRYQHQWRRRFKAEWKKALTAPSTNATQAHQSTGGHPREDTERDFARRWLAIMTTAADALVPGSDRHNARALLWALAWLAWRTGRRHIEAGTRSYSRGCAGLIDHSTAAKLLTKLRDLPEHQRPLRRISSGRGTHGDLYELIIPPAYAELATDPATWPEPRPIPGVFGVRDPENPRSKLLGATGWRVHQALANGATGTATQIARAAGVSRSEAYAVLPTLVRLQLAAKISTSQPGTASSGADWEVGERSVDQAGGAADAPAHLAALDQRHRAERATWRQVLADYAERRAAAIERTPECDEPLWWPPEWAAEPGRDPDQQRYDQEEAALALLSETFGAQIVPVQRAVPQRRPDWIGERTRREKRNAQTLER
ncbi:hypothetical protein [Actinoplanes sp. NPDC051851]|uniref:hypothetical protein n=1 Tax=Actinoplanes sp. NPDC051851 TaxID=3154753 RepID=UPI003428C730